MSRKACLLLIPSILLAIPVLGGLDRLKSDSNEPPNTALINGMWFDGKTFEARTVYSVDGRFTAKKPDHVDHTLDLAGTYIVPPFGESHNHNIGTGVEDRDRRAIRKYLADGVFYVKIQGNLPLTEEMSAASASISPTAST